MTDMQKRLRKEAGNKKNYNQYNGKKKKKEKFPYTDEQYEKRVVFGKILNLFVKTTIFTIFIKTYFTDCTTIKCDVELQQREDFKDKKYLALYKVAFMNVENDIVYVTLIRKHNCTADEYFSKFQKG